MNEIEKNIEEKDFSLSSFHIGNEIVFDKNYNDMVEHISSNLPSIMKDSLNFYKSDSQYKNVTLDVTEMTPISALKHILAVLTKTKGAIENASINIKKSEIKKLQKEEEYAKAEGYDKQLLAIEILEIEMGLQESQGYLKGALRKMSFFTTQYKSILQVLGKENITEEDYERNEERHHIMTAMKQALISSRPRGGVIDEGNQIYMFDMGINGAAAQQEVFSYLTKEGEMLANGEEPTFEMTMEWLNHCADRFTGCGAKSAFNRGLVSLDNRSLVKEISNAEKSD
jgi:hypothetical protein